MPDSKSMHSRLVQQCLEVLELEVLGETDSNEPYTANRIGQMEDSLPISTQYLRSLKVRGLSFLAKAANITRRAKQHTYRKNIGAATYIVC